MYFFQEVLKSYILVIGMSLGFACKIGPCTIRVGSPSCETMLPGISMNKAKNIT